MARKEIKRDVGVKDVAIHDGFWDKYQELVHTKVLPYQWEAINDRIPDIEPSHAVKNFRIAAGLEKGEYYGYVFQDSDLAKWLETLGYSLTIHPDPDLENTADRMIEVIEKAQASDGYLNTYYTVKEPGKRWTNLRESHELYCAGHFMEAAVAYYQATGKSRLLDVIRRYADLIDRTFGPEPGKLKGYCGHPEVELALVKLYEATGEERYLRLSRYFIDERGQEPYYFDLENKKQGSAHIMSEFRSFDRKYLQTHVPVRQQTTAEGHAVRVTYLYSAVADVAFLNGDTGLKKACEKVWDNITARRMYVTGGIGSTSHGEAFTCDYDLPNDSMYTETCASVGMVFFAHRMLKLEADRRYSDIMELELFNGALSGISLDGTRYFYVNPLEVWPESCAKNPGLRHVKPVRQTWYACACCPPNISRLIASLGKYIYTVQEDRVYVHLFIGGEAALEIDGSRIVVAQETKYPYDGKVRITIRTARRKEFPLYVRIPGWCGRYSAKVNGESIADPALEKGYLKISRIWAEGDAVELSMDMPVSLVRASYKVRHTSGKAAIRKGPLVYCLEETDNGPYLHDITLADDPEWTSQYDPNLLGGTVVIKGKAFRTDESRWGDAVLYASRETPKRPVEIKAVPYCLWCNREPGEMTVWIRTK